MRHKHKIKYYACGEYGEKHQRCHFHALILRPANDSIEYTRFWNKGQVDVGSVTDASIAYCTGYVLKANAVPKGVPNKNRPFHIWSRGIGDEFMNGKTFLEMAREGNIPRRWRALADSTRAAGRGIQIPGRQTKRMGKTWTTKTNRMVPRTNRSITNTSCTGTECSSSNECKEPTKSIPDRSFLGPQHRMGHRRSETTKQRTARNQRVLDRSTGTLPHG